MNNTKVAIITGGGKGIGKAIAEQFLFENMQVVIADINSPHKLDLQKSNLLFVKTDVKNEKSVQNLINKTISRFGRIDVLINNAGILPDNLPQIEKISLELWNNFIETNLTGPFLCSKHAIPYLRKQNGSIVNIASTRAFQSEGNDAPYSASKGGLVALTHALAIGLGPDIRVNSISPGWIHTEKTPLKRKDHEQHPAGRVGQPQDIASFVSYLISERAGFITGQNFIIDGGMSVKMVYV